MLMELSLGITAYSYGELRENTKFLNGIRISDKSKDKLNVFDSSDVNNAFNTINNTLKNMITHRYSDTCYSLGR